MTRQEILELNEDLCDEIEKKFTDTRDNLNLATAIVNTALNRTDTYYSWYSIMKKAAQACYDHQLLPDQLETIGYLMREERAATDAFDVMSQFID